MTSIADLAGTPIFCAWQEELRAGQSKVTKVPYGVDGKRAESNDPATFLTLQNAGACATNLKTIWDRANPRIPWVGGIGVFLGQPLDGTPEGPVLIGFDFDSCFDDSGIAPWALSGLQTINSYCEMSPSATGAKAFSLLHPADAAVVRLAIGIRRGGFGRKFSLHTGNAHPPGIEVYTGVRFFALTWSQINITGLELNYFGEAQARALMNVIRDLLGVDPAAAPEREIVNHPSAPISDDRLREIVDGRPDLRRLWDGDPSDLADDHSRSAFANAIFTRLRDAGLSKDDAAAALRECPSTSAWMAEKGDALGGREIERIHEKVGNTVWEQTGPLPMVEGLSSKDAPVGTPRKPRKRYDEDEAGTALVSTLKPNARKRDDDEPPGPAPTTSTDGRMVIPLRVGLASVAADAEAAIIHAGVTIYQNGDAGLVRPYMMRAKGLGGRDITIAALTPLTIDDALRLLSIAAHFVKFDGRSKAWVACDPPPRAAATWLAAIGEWKVPAIRGILSVPTLRPDGSLLHEPGLDTATGLYLTPYDNVHMPPGWDKPYPTREDAMAALETLGSLIVEFPFVTEVDRSVAFSGMITPVIRGMLHARPLHALAAHTPGSGKSFLADICTAIALGQPAPAMSIGKSPEETEKRLGAQVLSGITVCVIDNVNGDLEGDLIAQITDRPRVNVRVLGMSKLITVENGLCLFANGNNLTIKADLVRRSVTCNLDPKMENPETREFRGDPLTEVMNNQGKYIAAVLTIVRAHVLAGCPGYGAAGAALASFGDWDRHVRGSLLWLGCADPLLSQTATKKADPTLSDLDQIIRAWRVKFGVGEISERSAKDALDTFLGVSMQIGATAVGAGLTALNPVTEQVSMDAGTMRDAVMRVCAFRGVPDATRFGNWLLRNRGRVIGGCRFMRSAKGWMVESTSMQLVTSSPS